MYEVWGRGGRVSSHEDKALANKAFRRQDAPAALTLGASVLAVRDGTTPKQRAAIEHAVAVAHAGEEKIAVPTPGPAAPKTHRTPLVARRSVEVDDETDDGDARDESCADDADDADDDGDDELPTADAPRDPTPAVERPVEVAAPAPTPTALEVSMAGLKTCAVARCTHPVPGTRSDTRPFLALLCAQHRSRAGETVRLGKATEADVIAYLSVKRHPNTAAATAARLAKRSSGTTAKKPASVASPVATSATSATSDADTIQVTIALPSAVARAYRCALSVGGVEALERLIAALPTTVRP